jgi:hypothetical protein
MRRNSWIPVSIVLAVALLPLVAIAQEQAADGAASDTTPSGDRPENVSLFGGTQFAGGHLKYTYKVSREGIDGYSITTTEITPQDDGMYLVESSSSDLVPLDRANVEFFGIALGGLGFRIPMTGGGAIDLSPLESIEDQALVPGKEYILPDGGYLVAGDAGTIAGIAVVYATYTHADYSNVSINLAMPTDLEIRNLLPIFPYLEFKYTAAEQTSSEEVDNPIFHMYSKIELVDFVYEPLEE